MRHFIRIVFVVAFAGLTACSPLAGPTERPAETIVEVLREPVLTADAVLPEQDARLVDVIVEPGSLEFVYDGPGATPPATGSVVVGHKNGGYLRRLGTMTSPDATRFRFDTEVAQLTDFFEDVHFRVAFQPATTSWIQDADGTEFAGRTDGLGGKIKLIPDLNITERCGFPSSANIEVTADLQPTFSTEVDIFRRNARHLKIEIGGELTIAAKATLSNGITLECRFEIPASSLPSREFTNFFFVGIVPVAITHTFEASVGFETSFGINNGTMEATAEARLGFDVSLEYNQGRGWTSTGSGTRSATGSASTNESLTATFGVKFNPALMYTLKLYDALGPQIALTPKFEAQVNVDRCSWNANIKGALDARLSPKLDVPVFDNNLLEVDFDLHLIAQGEIWSDMGEFPWCADSSVSMDGGVMDASGGGGRDAGGGDAGGMGGGDAGGMGGDSGGGDAATDPCATHSTCDTCNEQAGCGFCSGRCMSDSERSTCADWQGDPSSCHTCDYGDCDSCASDGFCGWCPSMGCLNDSVYVEEGGMCAGYAVGPGMCG